MVHTDGDFLDPDRLESTISNGPRSKISVLMEAARTTEVLVMLSDKYGFFCQISVVSAPTPGPLQRIVSSQKSAVTIRLIKVLFAVPPSCIFTKVFQHSA